MATPVQQIADVSGWSVSLTADPGVRGQFGAVYLLQLVNNSTAPVTLWCIYKGQTLSVTAQPGATAAHDFTKLNPAAGQVTAWGVR